MNTPPANLGGLAGKPKPRGDPLGLLAFFRVFAGAYMLAVLTGALRDHRQISRTPPLSANLRPRTFDGGRFGERSPESVVNRRGRFSVNPASASGLLPHVPSRWSHVRAAVSIWCRGWLARSVLSNNELEKKNSMG